MKRIGAKSKTDEIVEQVEKDIKEKPVKKEKKFEFISTGSWLINLAISDLADGGYPLGDLCNVIGDSDTAKTLLCLAMMAEGVRDPRFNDYDFVYYAIETGMYFPMETMFQGHLHRINMIKKSPWSAQDWQAHILKQAKKPIISALDSVDALTTDEELDLMEEEDTKKRKEGFSNLLKPKSFSKFLSPIVGRIASTNSVLIAVSQTRDNIGVSFGPAKRRAGGVALKFYSSCEMWLSPKEKIYKKIRGEDHEIGKWVRVKVARTRITGKEHEVMIPVYNRYGVDNLGSAIEWLVHNRFWGIVKPDKTEKKALRELVAEKENKKDKKEKEIVDTGGDFINANRAELRKHIESGDLEDKLKQILQESWNELEVELELDFKPKYGPDNLGKATPTFPSTEEQIQHQVMIS
jgi:RecA/RadA recombinase